MNKPAAAPARAMQPLPAQFQSELNMLTGTHIHAGTSPTQRQSQILNLASRFGVSAEDLENHGILPKDGPADR